jgi:polyisoprenoid-binding protein YceI
METSVLMLVEEKGMPHTKHIAIIVAVVLSLCFAGVALGTDTYTVDRSHTTVGFTVRHLLINKVRGKFNDFSGTITYDENDITKSSMQGTINAASIDTDHEKRDKHLRSPDFFDVANYPEITFNSKRVVKENASLVLVGDLTMRGVTKEVEIPFEITGKIKNLRGEMVIGFEATLSIDRQDFGIAYSRTMDNGGLVVGNQVNIELVGEAVLPAS